MNVGVVPDVLYNQFGDDVSIHHNWFRVVFARSLVSSSLMRQRLAHNAALFTVICMVICICVMALWSLSTATIAVSSANKAVLV